MNTGIRMDTVTQADTVVPGHGYIGQVPRENTANGGEDTTGLSGRGPLAGNISITTDRRNTATSHGERNAANGTAIPGGERNAANGMATHGGKRITKSTTVHRGGRDAAIPAERGSTYTYLSVSRIKEIAAREGLSLRWRPFSVRTLMLEQDNRPFVGNPIKMRYMWRDIERRAKRYGLPFTSIPTYPVDPEELANRVVVHLRSLLAALGKDPDATIDRADHQDIRDRYASETDVARDLGIFGSPTFVSGSEIFWGDDRFEDAIEWSRSHAQG